MTSPATGGAAAPDGVPAVLSPEWQHLYEVALRIDEVQRRGGADLESTLLDINEVTAASCPRCTVRRSDARRRQRQHQHGRRY